MSRTMILGVSTLFLILRSIRKVDSQFIQEQSKIFTEYILARNFRIEAICFCFKKSKKLSLGRKVFQNMIYFINHCLVIKIVNSN